MDLILPLYVFSRTSVLQVCGKGRPGAADTLSAAVPCRPPAAAGDRHTHEPAVQQRHLQQGTFRSRTFVGALSLRWYMSRLVLDDGDAPRFNICMMLTTNKASPACEALGPCGVAGLQFVLWLSSSSGSSPENHTGSQLRFWLRPWSHNPILAAAHWHATRGGLRHQRRRRVPGDREAHPEAFDAAIRHGAIVTPYLPARLFWRVWARRR